MKPSLRSRQPIVPKQVMLVNRSRYTRVLVAVTRAVIKTGSHCIDKLLPWNGTTTPAIYVGLSRRYLAVLGTRTEQHEGS